MSSTEHLLPPNATPAERALALAVARLSAVPVGLEALWRPAACPAALLPWLAWALSVDHWDSAWSEAIQRARVVQAIGQHRIKGTPAAIERALVAAGALSARVAEWWEYAAAPYRFRVEIDLAAEAVTPAMEAALGRQVAAHQNARSWFDGVIVTLACAGPVPAWSIGYQSSEVGTVYPR